jgi:Xaa-Pro aminopeptidase
MPTHLPLLRVELARQHLDGCIVPHADEYQNEYLPAGNERLAWLTGFTGSAGLAIVTQDRAALFADGRYTLQAAAQAPDFEQHHLLTAPPEKWLKEHAQGLTIGYDSWLFTPRQLEKLAESGITLQPVAANPIDAVWADRPPAPTAPIVPHDPAYSGETSREKRRKIIAKLDADAVVITDPASIAWLLNVRGGDVPCTPLPLSRVILHKDGRVDWFVNPAKLKQCELDDVTVRPETNFLAALIALPGRVQLDPATAPVALFQALDKDRIHQASDPCTLPKACKNAAELEGVRAAHRRDGVALAVFFTWLAGADIMAQTELDIVAKLESCRASSNLYRGPSFETIAGSGPNGAIVHYRADAASNRALSDGFLLLDSGGQYLDGTTDITRTIPIGRLTAAQRRMFTLVLKGHIAIATARFPKGTTGAQLDTLARQFLWQAGANYDHGTGHGVGCYLSVHEGPQGISSRANTTALQPGMILSNEPGYYENGEYGIRIENLITVREGADGYLEFETLSFAPIAREAIDAELLSPAERAWLNAYHAEVREKLLPQLAAAEADWLRQATSPL